MHTNGDCAHQISDFACLAYFKRSDVMSLNYHKHIYPIHAPTKGPKMGSFCIRYQQKILIKYKMVKINHYIALNNNKIPTLFSWPFDSREFNNNSEMLSVRKGEGRHIFPSVNAWGVFQQGWSISETGLLTLGKLILS